MGLGHTGGDRSNSHLAHQLDADAGGAVGIFQIVNEFREILDGVNVVVRRRRNESHSRRRVPDFGNPWIDFSTRQLAAFAGLRALRHLDLQLLGLREVKAGDAEPSGRHLLDGAVLGVALLVGPGITLGILSALAGVGFPADAVHGDGEAFVGFLGNGSVAHGAGFEALENGVHRFHFLNRNGGAFFEFQQSTQGEDLFHLVVHQIGIRLERLVAAGAHRLLQGVDDLRAEKVCLTFGAPLVVATDFERLACDLAVGESMEMALENFGGESFQISPLDARGGAGEIFVHQGLLQSDAFENLRAQITLDRGNADFRSHLDNALGGGFHEILAGGVVIHAHEQPLADHVVERFKRKVGIDGGAAVTNERAEVMHFARLAGFEHQSDARALAFANQEMVQRGNGQQRGNDGVVFIHAAIAEDDDVDSGIDLEAGLVADFRDGFFQTCCT